MIQFATMRHTVLLISSIIFITQLQAESVVIDQRAGKTMVDITTGRFIMGSTQKQREYGYQLDELRGSTAARQYRWFENETAKTLTLPLYQIDRDLVSNGDYQLFITQAGYAAPYVNEETWAGYGLVHDYKTVRRFLWEENRLPTGRDQHPVVLVTHADAMAYCRWRGEKENRPLTLPTEAQWEKAARGTQGLVFPWGDLFVAENLNSADKGPYDTQVVGSYPGGASPFGVNDMAGMVFEWTATACPGDSSKFIVKGGSWDDYPGVTRSAAHHCRPASLKHVLIGFRCVSH